MRLRLIHTRYLGFRVFVIACVLLSFSAKGQLPVNPDSTLAALQKNIPDSTRVLLLNDLGFTIQKKGLQAEANQHFHEALALAEKINFPRGQVYSLINLGLLETNEKKYASAEEFYKKGFDLASKIHDTLGIARYYHKVGVIQFLQKNYRQGIELFKKAAAFYEAIDDQYPAEATFYCLNDLGKIGNAANLIGDYPTAEEYALKTISYSEKVGDESSVARSYYELGAARYVAHHYEEAALPLQTSIQLFDKISALEVNNVINDVLNLANAYAFLGNIYCKYQKKIKEGVPHLEKAISMYDELRDMNRKGWVLCDLAAIRVLEGDYVKALEIYFEALETAQVSGNPELIAQVHKEIGRVLLNNKNYEDSRHHLQEARKQLEGSSLTLLLGETIQSLAILELKCGNRQAASENYNRLIQIGTATRDTHMLTTGYVGTLDLGETFDNYEEILQYFLHVNEKEEKHNETHHLITHYRFTGTVYQRTGDYKMAETYYLKSLALAEELQVPSERIITYQRLQENHLLQNQYDKAYMYNELWRKLEDSISTAENRRMLAEMQGKYDKERNAKEIERLINEQRFSELERKSLATLNLYNAQQLELLASEKSIQELQLKENENKLLVQKAEAAKKEGEFELLSREADLQKLTIKKQSLARNYMLAGFGVFVLLSLLLYTNYRTRQKLKLQTLRNRIASDLHDDVGSTLSSISIFSEMAKNESGEINPLLDTIGESSRKMLDAMADIVWTINPENDQFEKIIERMKIFAFDLLGSKKIDFEFDAAEDIQSLKLSMEIRKNLFLIFKEATNNMAKYSDADKAHFSIRGDQKIITMVIRDNGKGFDTGQYPAGNGLKNMRKRAEEIGGQLYIESKKEVGTEIRLKLAV